jgi:orotidine-5'-phosphate decarboxylase
MSIPPKEKIIVAIDTPDAPSSLRLVESLGDTVGWVKIGLQLFTAEGPSIVRQMKDLGRKVFLDLKFHDIPNTAREAVHSALALGVDMTTIHLAGGRSMVKESVGAAENSPLLVLGVTVLTSMNEAELNGIGIPRTPAEQVEHLVALGTEVGLRGVVCSPLEISLLRSRFGNSLTIVTPGVRPLGSASGDQSRIMTPADALRAGADHLVIGRPITAAPSPRDAAKKILGEISEAT